MAAEQLRKPDGSAGDADYRVIGRTYSDYRRPDPRIAQAVWDALGDAHAVLNVGAGAGSYEPTDRDVTAIEPSASMRNQRPAALSAAVDAVAESLPFPDDSFDAAMTTFSVHQWGDTMTVDLVPIPLNCTDGFNEAYYGRPEELLVAGARAACSAWSFVDPAQADQYTATLRTALDSGEWDAKYGALRRQPTFEGSLVIARAVP